MKKETFCRYIRQYETDMFRFAKRIKREKMQEQMPESTRKRMDDLLDGLPEETKRSKIHRIWKNAVVFVAVLSLSTVTVFAGAKLITLGTGKLKKKVNLDIKTNYLWDTKGDWSMQLTVDRSKVAKKVKVITRSKKSIVDRVIISPLGNTLRSNDKKHDLVIRDNKGRYLYYEEKTNSENSKDIYQFFKHKDTRSLEIIPVKEQSVVTKNGKVQKAVLNLKKNEIVKVSDHTRLKVADVKKQKHNLRIYFKVLDYDGAILTDGLENRFIVDNKGRSLIKDGGSIDTWTDYEKEQLVLEFYNASKGVDYTKAAKINFLKQKTVLNEKQKIKIK